MTVKLIFEGGKKPLYRSKLRLVARCELRSGHNAAHCSHYVQHALKRALGAVLAALLLPTLCFGADFRNTDVALRYMNAAVSAYDGGDYDSAQILVDTALANDDGISDLWYLSYKISAAQNARPVDCIPLLEKAVTLGDWHKYSVADARTELARLYRSTGRLTEELAELKAAPALRTADALALQAEAFYRTGDYGNARSVVSDAVQLYPDDVRFVRFFFEYELVASGLEDATRVSLGKSQPLSRFSPTVAAMGRRFLSHVYEYAEKDRDILLYAAYFADAENAARYLSEYVSRPYVNPFYAESAFANGVLDGLQAVSEFMALSGDTVDYTMLCGLCETLRDADEDAAIDHLRVFLWDFSGTMLFDTNWNSIADINCRYVNGKLVAMESDANNDGILNWICDFVDGVPSTLQLPEESLEIIYSRFPAIEKLVNTATNQTFLLVPDKFEWQAFSIEQSQCFDEFYVPYPSLPYNPISAADLVYAAYRISTPVSEREGAWATFALLDGKPQSATYTQNGKLYATAEFVGGNISTRAVDFDGDGFFEKREFYDFNRNAAVTLMTKDEENTLFSNLFGSTDSMTASLGVTGIYLSSVAIDTDADRNANFLTVWNPDGGTASGWKQNTDGMWQTMLSVDKDSNVQALTLSNPVDHMPVTMHFDNGEPVSVQSDGLLFVVEKQSDAFYWLILESRKDEFDTLVLRAADVLESIAKNAVASMDFSSGSSAYSCVFDCAPLISSRFDSTTIAKLFGDSRIMVEKAGNVCFGWFCND